MYALFDRFAERYDLHTPPDHYRHDHAFVLGVAGKSGSGCHMLDVGCGTGVLLEKAHQAGFVAKGIDASPGMVEVARFRAGRSNVTLRRMQEIDEEAAYDLIVALSWTINYCANVEELRDVLRRLRRALRPGGRMLLQVAHAMNVDGEPLEDLESGPSGVPGDVVFGYRFERLGPEGLKMRAEYSYACKSLGERLHEVHVLQVTDARLVAECMRKTGLRDVELFDSWRRDAFSRSASPFVYGVKETRGS